MRLSQLESHARVALISVFGVSALCSPLVWLALPGSASSSPASPTERELPPGRARVAVRVLAPDDFGTLQVFCHPTDGGRALWQEELRPNETLLREVPAGPVLRLWTRDSTRGHGRETFFSVEPGSTIACDLDYSDVVVCRFRLEGVPDLRDVHCQADVRFGKKIDRTVSQWQHVNIDRDGRFSLYLDRGTPFCLKLRSWGLTHLPVGIRLLDTRTGSNSFVAEQGPVHRVRPSRPLCVIETECKTFQSRPSFQVRVEGSDVRPNLHAASPGPPLLLPCPRPGERYVVSSSRGWQELDASRLEAGSRHQLRFPRRLSRVIVETTGSVPAKLEYAIRLSGVAGVTALSTRVSARTPKGKLRRLICEVPPGSYRCEWVLWSDIGQQLSPVVAHLHVPPDEELHLRLPCPDPAARELPLVGAPRWFHDGEPGVSLRTKAGLASYSESGILRVRTWRPGAVPPRLTIRAGCGWLSLALRAAGHGAKLELEPVLVTLQVHPAGSGRFQFVSDPPGAGHSLNAGRDPRAAFLLPVPRNTPVAGALWETPPSAAHKRRYRGHVRFVAERHLRTLDLHLPGRDVLLKSEGPPARLRVELQVDGPPESDARDILLGDVDVGHDARFWIPHGVRTLLLRDGDRVVRRVALQDETDRIRLRIDRSAPPKTRNEARDPTSSPGR